MKKMQKKNQILSQGIEQMTKILKKYLLNSQIELKWYYRI